MENPGIWQMIIIILIVLIIFYLIIRELNCWYWKINKRIEQTKQTNLLLEKIYLQLGGLNKTEEKSSYDEKIRAIEGLIIEEYENLSNKEKEELFMLIFYSGISKGDKIAINKESRKIKKFNVRQWQDLTMNKRVLNQWVILVTKETI